ncbi:MAG: ATP synthase F0 subunit B [Desulfobacterales bacterium]|jgi:F-type H+-transporting ATPase subunit b
MKRINKIVRLCCFIIAGAASSHFLGLDALASEGSGGWRPIYDEILLWINFGIIAFVFVKYGKTPLMNFLRGQKEKVAKDIERVEQKKEEAVNRIKEIQKVLDEKDARFAIIKDRIVRQGERKKQEIVESAHQQSQMMLNDAKRRIDSQFVQAKSAFRAELIDAAIELAMQRLPLEITDEDNDKFLDQYLASELSD